MNRNCTDMQRCVSMHPACFHGIIASPQTLIRQYLLKTQAVVDAHIGPKIRYLLIVVFAIKLNRFWLLFSRFEDTGLDVHFLAPGFQFLQNKRRNSGAPPVCRDEHSFDLHGVLVIRFYSATTHGSAFIVGQYNMLNRVDFVVLRIKRMVVAVSNAQIQVESPHQFLKVGMI